MTRAGRPLALFLLAVLTPPGAAGAQEPPDTTVAQETPDTAGRELALVLSGGGSRGMAHAGAMQGLEEAGYDPDLVVGTSMGAVVGALYAAGYAPDEIVERLLGIDWGGLFAPAPVVIGPERTVRYPMLGLDLEVERLRFSRGVIGQWRINRALAHLLFEANARARGDFDRMARRYRAVAADLETGDEVVLAEGDIARAARASMAVPGFFAPVLWNDGRVLVDGGIANNLPTSVARALGAERIIAVEVSRTPEVIHSQEPLSVVQRALDLMQENTQRDTIPPDALVLPDIEPGFTGANFPEDPTPLFELGLAAARRDLPPAAPLPGGGERPLPPAPDSFAALVLEAPDSALAALAARIFQGVVPGPYDPDAVLRAVDRLYTTGLFEAIWVRALDRGEGGAAAAEADGHDGEGATAPHEAASAPDVAPALKVRLDAPPGLTLAAAAGYESDRGARAWGSLDRYVALARRPAVLTAAASTDGLEHWVALSARVYMLRRPSLAWSVGAYLEETDVRFFLENAIGAEDVHRAGGWAALEFPHVLSDQLTTATLRAEWLAVEDGARGGSFGPLLRFTSLNPELLLVGFPFRIEAERRWGTFTYTRLALRGSRALRLGRLHVAALADARAVSAGAPPDVRPALGDEHLVPGLPWGKERGTATAVAGLDGAYPLLVGFARLRLRAGVVSSERDPWDAAEWVGGAQLAAVWQGPIGTVEVGYGLTDRGEGQLDVSIGRRF